MTIKFCDGPLDKSIVGVFKINYKAELNLALFIFREKKLFLISNFKFPNVILTHVCVHLGDQLRKNKGIQNVWHFGLKTKQNRLKTKYQWVIQVFWNQLVLKDGDNRMILLTY